MSRPAMATPSGCKMWNNPFGWREVVAHLKQRGYRVVCIDQKPVHGSGLLYTSIPHGAEDETGDRLLTERARWLKHADAFVGLSSGGESWTYSTDEYHGNLWAVVFGGGIQCLAGVGGSRAVSDGETKVGHTRRGSSMRDSSNADRAATCSAAASKSHGAGGATELPGGA